MATNKQINYEILDACCRSQCTGEECAAALEIDYDTLNAALKRDGNVGFTDYFKKARCGGLVSLRRAQFEKALEGSVPMQIWLGKNYLDQKDQIATETKTAVVDESELSW